ncbi:MAG: hypothetical protein AB1505_31925 [Candidatus Latescibacterota bacterium]
MDAGPGFAARLRSALPLMAATFAVGFAIAGIDPRPKLILTVSIAVTAGMLVLGPYAAAALYGLRLQRILGGRLRWPLCLVLAGTAVLLSDLALRWSHAELVVAGVAALAGTILGHDATLAVLRLQGTPHLDRRMVALFPVLVGLAAVAGYSSFGFGAGSVQFVASLLRRP